MKSMTSRPSFIDRDCRDHGISAQCDSRRSSGGIGDDHRGRFGNIRINNYSKYDRQVRHDHRHSIDAPRSAPTPTPTPTPRWQPPKQYQPQNAHVRPHGSLESTVGSASGTRPQTLVKNIDGRKDHQSNHGNGKTNQRHQNRRQSRRPGKPYDRPSKPLVISPDIMHTDTEKDTHNAPSSSTTESNPTTQESSMTTDPPKLDPTNPSHARRIHQRRRQVLFGKNTAGYEEYIQKVPKHQRMKRNMDHPSTPDHTLDVPTRRWQGMMNAWRRALHKFDPPDLTTRQNSTNNVDITLAPRTLFTEQDKIQEEITKAKAAGLQVAFGSMSVGGIGGTADLFKPGVAANTEESGAENGGDTREDIDDKELAFKEEEAYRRTIGNHDEMEESSSALGDIYDDSEANVCIMLNGNDKQNRLAAMVAKNNCVSSIGDEGFLEEGCDCDSDDDLL